MAPSAGALSYRKLPRLFKPSHCQLLRHHAQFVAMQFYIMQLVAMKAASRSLEFSNAAKASRMLAALTWPSSTGLSSSP